MSKQSQILTPPLNATIFVEPTGFTGGTVDCGLAGTVMRFVPPLAALADGDVFLMVMSMHVNDP